MAQFRRRLKDSCDRHSECGRCHAEAVQSWRAAKKSRERQKGLARYATTIRRLRDDAKVRALTISMIDSFGGVEAFAQARTEQIRHVTATANDPATVLKSLETIVRLLACIDQD